MQHAATQLEARMDPESTEVASGELLGLTQGVSINKQNSELIRIQVFKGASPYTSLSSEISQPTF